MRRGQTPRRKTAMTEVPQSAVSYRDASILELVGVDALSEQVYRSVLLEGSTTVEEVARRHRMTPLAAEDRLAALRAIGLLARRSGASGEYVPVDPRFSLRAITDRHERGMAAIREQVPALAELFDSGIDATRGTPQTRILSDPAEIAGWFVQLQHQAVEEFMAFDRPPYVSDPSNPLETLALDRGVRWRAIYTADSFGAENAWSRLASLGELGEDARITTSLPIKLAIADRSIALFSLTLETGVDNSMVTESPPLVAALCELFELRWERATPIPAGRGDDPTEDARRARRRAPAATRATATREQRTVLTLIAAGMTDEGIAHQLGVSSRTLRRKTQELMVELRAENRFQAGAEAVRRGWI